MQKDNDTMEIEIPRDTQAKRGQSDKSSGKNTKRPRTASRGLTPIPNGFWLDLLTLEKLYIERGAPLAPTCIIMESIVDKVEADSHK